MSAQSVGEGDISHSEEATGSNQITLSSKFVYQKMQMRSLNRRAACMLSLSEETKAMVGMQNTCMGRLAVNGTDVETSACWCISLEPFEALSTPGSIPSPSAQGLCILEEWRTELDVQ